MDISSIALTLILFLSACSAIKNNSGTAESDISNHHQIIFDCYKQELDNENIFEEEVMIRFHINHEGRAEHIKVQDNLENDFYQCISLKIANVQFTEKNINYSQSFIFKIEKENSKMTLKESDLAYNDSGIDEPRELIID